jgi:hypothetical protein
MFNFLHLQTPAPHLDQNCPAQNNGIIDPRIKYTCILVLNFYNHKLGFLVNNLNEKDFWQAVFSIFAGMAVTVSHIPYL